MMVLLIEVAIVVVVALVLYALRNKIRFFRGGYVIQRESFVQDNKVKLIVEDMYFFRDKERNNRMIHVDKTNLVYSRIPMDKKDNALLVCSYNAPILAMLKGSGVDIQRTLVLGGGGGAVPLYILQNYDKAIVDIVEISAECIQISERYFLQDYIGEGSRVRQIHDDAKNAVKELAPAYQYIFCDLYIGGQPADVVYDTAFIGEISRLSGKDGLLVINGSGFSMEGVRVMLKNLLAAFAYAWVMLLSDGFVLMASNRNMPQLDNLLRHGQGVVPLYPSMVDIVEPPKPAGDETPA